MGVNSSKSSQSSNSSNQAYPFLKDSLGGEVGNVNAASSGLSALLGGDASGFNGFKTATGFNDTLDNGFKGITGSAAAHGLLHSGSTAKSLQNYGQMLTNQSAQTYLANLLGLGQLGLGAGNIISSAGSVSNSQGKGSGKGIQFPSPVPGG